MREVVLRGYRTGDAAAMYAIDLICFEEPFRFDLKSMTRFAEARNALVVIAERRRGREGSDAAEARRGVWADPAGEMLGFVIVHVERGRGGQRGYVVTLDELPEERRSGLAGRLMAEAERLAVEAGAGRMELDVFEGNEGAIRFYERQGYLHAGRRRGFYGTVPNASGAMTSMDALALVKEIGSISPR